MMCLKLLWQWVTSYVRTAIAAGTVIQSWWAAKCRWHHDCFAAYGNVARIRGRPTDHSAAIEHKTDASAGGAFITLVMEWLLPNYKPTWSYGSGRQSSKPSMHFSSYTIRKVRIKWIFGWIRFFRWPDYYKNFCAIPIESENSVGDCITSHCYRYSMVQCKTNKAYCIYMIVGRLKSWPTPQS